MLEVGKYYRYIGDIRNCEYGFCSNMVYLFEGGRVRKLKDISRRGSDSVSLLLQGYEGYYMYNPTMFELVENYVEDLSGPRRIKVWAVTEDICNYIVGTIVDGVACDGDKKYKHWELQ